MIKEDLYQKTVDILVNAYLNDTLIRGDCSTCAVGNIVAANMGYKIINEDNDLIGRKGISWKDKNGNFIPYAGTYGWGRVHCFNRNYGQKFDLSEYKGEAKKQIDSTGYSSSQTAAIERAFEQNFKGEDKMFNALCAVIDTLDVIHKNTDKEFTREVKNKFVKV
jgi:hypothetical protein